MIPPPFHSLCYPSPQMLQHFQHWFYTVQAKSALLHYLRTVVELMEPCDFYFGGDTIHAVTKIICWTLDNKNVEVRKVCVTHIPGEASGTVFINNLKVLLYMTLKSLQANGYFFVWLSNSLFFYFQAAQLVVIALFSLNTAGFSQMLSSMPKTYQVCEPYLHLALNWGLCTLIVIAIVSSSRCRIVLSSYWVCSYVEAHQSLTMAASQWLRPAPSHRISSHPTHLQS